uniref:Caspase recruitment domain-containing protein 18 isoform X2 n=1 Tax=Petromyzon marinus TaxID=7757 RepID=A0AAJ7T2B9_PETMA|nr:caspase recruitment domain-containing protein 18 isoform X2 [Petromyzon marinus]
MAAAPAYGHWPGTMGPLKRWVLESHEKIVDALYSIDHLLDRLISKLVLTDENYNEVRAEPIPTKKARKLLEIVRLQFSEQQVEVFVECLANSQTAYPKLRTLLQHRPQPGEVKSFPTVEKLRRQSSELCHRLGDLTAPITVQLFANELLGQVEKEHVENANTPFDRSKKLIDVCLRRGEPACCLFYKALRHEDPNLASEMGAFDVENVTCLSIETTGETPQCSLLSQVSVCPQTPVTTAFPETGVQGDLTWLVREKSTDEPRSLATSRDFDPATPNSSSNNGFDPVFSDSLTLESLGGESVTLSATEQELANEVMHALSLEATTATTGPDYDILSFSELLGLGREHAWEALQEAGGWDVRRQVTALVCAFLKATGGDAQRLRNKLHQAHRSCKAASGGVVTNARARPLLPIDCRMRAPSLWRSGRGGHLAMLGTRWSVRINEGRRFSHSQGFLVSERGVCLMNLISKAHQAFRAATDATEGVREALRLLAIVLHDCALALAPDEELLLPDAAARLPPPSVERCLRRVAETVPFHREGADELLGDLGDPDEAFLEQASMLAAQLVRELFKVGSERGSQYGLHVRARDAYACTPHSLWGVTGFAGLSPLVVKKLCREQQSENHEELRASLRRILARTSQSPADNPLGGGGGGVGVVPDVQMDVDSLLRCGRFDARLSARVRWALEPDAERRGPALPLHAQTLADLLEYARRSERHSFAFRVERVTMLGGRGRSLCGVRSAGPLVRIDGAMEETVGFLTSEPAAFLASVRCAYVHDGEAYECAEPRVCKVAFPRASSAATAAPPRVDLADAVSSGEVVAESPNAVWIRAREGVAFESVVGDVKAALASSSEPFGVETEGFCFRVEAHERESQVRLFFDGNGIRAESTNGAVVKT